MSSVSSEPSPAEMANQRPSTFRKIANSHWTFIALQGLDLLTTMVAFRMGAFEVNPLVAHLTATFGRFNGVLISKLIAIGIATGVRKLIWVVNAFYALIIMWNCINLVALSRGH
jgi:hypothetical protein